MDLNLISQIAFENHCIQQLNAKDGPTELAAAYERITKLVWMLLQANPSHINYRQAWELLVDYGEKELRYVLLYYEVSDRQKYMDAFNRLIYKINIVVSILP